jgi:type IV secretory pathway VirD2 relaxase
MGREKFPISNQHGTTGLPGLNPDKARGGGRRWLKSLGRTTVKRQPRMTTTGGGRRIQPKLSALKAYRRRSVVKIAYNRQKGKPWRERAQYLVREHAQKENERGIGFDATHEEIDMVAIADGWQKDGDPLLWRFIISPEDSNQIDIREHVRELMAGMERDLDTKLEWIGIDHHPADEDDHVHVLLRGMRDDGKELKLDRDYLTTGIRELSQSLIEKELGPRSEHDMLVGRERGIQGEYWTELDRVLQRRQDADRIVAYEGTPWTQEGKDRMRQEVERLVFLEKIGLAQSIGESTWQLSPDHESKLREMQHDHDILKRLARERQQGLERENG